MHTIRIAKIGRRPKHEPVDDREHRGVRTDAQRERQYDAGGEDGARAKPAGCITEILDDRLEENRSTQIARFFLGALDAAKRDASTTPRFVGRNAGADVLRGFTLDVEAQLVRKLALDSVATKQDADAVTDVAEQLVEQGGSPL